MARTQYALFPVENLRISQVPGSAFSHYRSCAVDITNGGKSPRCAKVYAPFDCVVTNTMPKFGAVFIQNQDDVEIITPQSQKEGRAPEKRMSMVFIHSNEPLPGVGIHFKQGELLTYMGDKGLGDGSVHVHLECGLIDNPNTIDTVIYPNAPPQNASGWNFPDPPQQGWRERKVSLTFKDYPSPHFSNLLFLANDSNYLGEDYPNEKHYTIVSAPEGINLCSGNSGGGGSNPGTPEQPTSPVVISKTPPNPSFMLMLQVVANTAYFGDANLTNRLGVLPAGKYTLLETLSNGYRAVVANGTYYLPRRGVTLTTGTVDEVKAGMSLSTSAINAKRNDADVAERLKTEKENEANIAEKERLEAYRQREIARANMEKAVAAVREQCARYPALELKVNTDIIAQTQNIGAHFQELFTYTAAFFERLATKLHEKTNELASWVQAKIEDVNTRVGNVRSPFSGEIMHLKSLFEDLFMAHRMQSVAAGEYEAIRLTALDYSGHEMTAFEYATNARAVLQELLEQYKQNTLTADRYDLLRLTAQVYDNYELTAVQYDTAAKLHLI